MLKVLDLASPCSFSWLICKLPCEKYESGMALENLVCCLGWRRITVITVHFKASGVNIWCTEGRLNSISNELIGKTFAINGIF